MLPGETSAWNDLAGMDPSRQPGWLTPIPPTRPFAQKVGDADSSGSVLSHIFLKQVQWCLGIRVLCLKESRSEN